MQKAEEQLAGKLTTGPISPCCSTTLVFHSLSYPCWMLRAVMWAHVLQLKLRTVLLQVQAHFVLWVLLAQMPQCWDTPSTDKSTRSFSPDKQSEDQCKQLLKQPVIFHINTRQSAFPLEIALSVFAILISKSKPLLDFCHIFCFLREDIKSFFLPWWDTNKSKSENRKGQNWMSSKCFQPLPGYDSHADVGTYKASETSLSAYKGHSRMENYLSEKGNSTESRHSTFSLLQEAHSTAPQAQLLGHHGMIVCGSCGEVGQHWEGRELPEGSKELSFMSSCLPGRRQKPPVLLST